MTVPGHRIVAGVSGGADSVCLLFVLLEYAKRMPVELAVVHVNHGLREDAGEDAEFVRQLCQREGVPFFLKEADVKELAEKEKLSLEEAGRVLRYRAFSEAAKAFGADRIAVAHNSNDRAETMLFHLFRGSGIRGLCSIPPRREEIIRPLLCLERHEIEAYLAQREIPYRTDSTNREDTYTRNRIRHHILPLAKREVSAAAVSHMCRTADMLSELEEYLEQMTEEAMKSCVSRQREDGGKYPDNTAAESAVITICADRFLQLHIALRKRLLLVLLRELAPGGRNIGAVHVEDVLALFEKEGNSRICLPFGIRAVKQYGKVCLERSKEPTEEDPCTLYREVNLPRGETTEPLIFDLEGGGRMEISVFYVKKGQKIPRNECTKWFDCDRIIESPVFRFRQTGDILSLSDGSGGIVHKSLKDYMITEKIPRESRNRIPVLAERNHILWLTGYRISEYYKVNENTKRILQVKLIRELRGQ